MPGARHWVPAPSTTTPGSVVPVTVARVTSSDDAATARIGRPDEAAITRHLRRLGTAYPGFTFSYATLGQSEQEVST